MAGMSQGGIVQTITKDGECKITIVLDLNVNLNNGNVTIAAPMPASPVVEKKEETSEWAIPEFTSEKIKFGK